MELLFGKLPEFFKSEAELRNLWSTPDTRKKLLQGLAEKGFGQEQLVSCPIGSCHKSEGWAAVVRCA